MNLNKKRKQQKKRSNDNDERNGIDQTKKMKISETTDTPIIETKEPENNIIVNGNATAVEV